MTSSSPVWVLSVPQPLWSWLAGAILLSVLTPFVHRTIGEVTMANRAASAGPIWKAPVTFPWHCGHGSYDGDWKFGQRALCFTEHFKVDDRRER